MNLELETKSIRELMPERFTRLILENRGKGSIANISTVVNTEAYTSQYWPYVEALAKSTDAEAYEARMNYLRERDKQLAAA